MRRLRPLPEVTYRSSTQRNVAVSAWIAPRWRVQDVNDDAVAADGGLQIAECREHIGARTESLDREQASERRQKSRITDVLPSRLHQPALLISRQFVEVIDDDLADDLRQRPATRTGDRDDRLRSVVTGAPGPEGVVSSTQ